MSLKEHPVESLTILNSSIVKNSTVKITEISSCRFYVKSKLSNVENEKPLFQQIESLWILILINSWSFLRPKLAKLSNFTAPKMAKMAVYKFQIIQNWFHVKSQWLKNAESSTLWHFLGPKLHFRVRLISSLVPESKICDTKHKIFISNHCANYQKIN